MPVQGLTVRSEVQARFPSLGKLRKGIRVRDDKTGKMVPKDLGRCFRFTSDQPGVEQAFEAAFGKSPNVLRVYLPYKTADENFATWREEWTAGGLVHRCDGRTMTVWYDDKSGKYATDPKPCPYESGEKRREPKAGKPGCVLVGRLNLIIPELLAAGFVGFVTFETHSDNDLRSIFASLVAAEELRAEWDQGRHAGLRGVEFRLWRQEEAISTPGEQGRVRRKKWLVKLAPAVRWVDMQYQLDRAAAMGQLPAWAGSPDDEDQEDQGEIEPGAPGGEIEPGAPGGDIPQDVAGGGDGPFGGNIPQDVQDGEFEPIDEDEIEVPEEAGTVEIPKSFENNKAALEWAVSVPGLFSKPAHAKRAYEMVKAQEGIKTPAQMWRAWTEYVVGFAHEQAELDGNEAVAGWLAQIGS